jgi:hypothetical protein
VARADLARAAGALAPLGWRARDRDDRPVLHLVLAHDAGLPEVELHWRLHWYETELGPHVLARARPGPDGVRRLGPVDELAALLLYHARDGFAGLRHSTDIAAWWDARADQSDGPPLAPIVREHQELTQALGASATVVDELAGVPAGGLVAARRLTWGAQRATRLANPLMRGKPQQITAEVALVDGLLAPAGERAAFVTRRVLVAPRDLATGTVRRPIALARVEHVLRMTRRMLLACVRPRARLQPPLGRGSDR